MPSNYEPGDFLVFQIESGFGLLRVLDVDERTETVWHLMAYQDLYLEVEQAEYAIEQKRELTPSLRHVAITNRAFESTQVSRIGHIAPDESELTAYRGWLGANEKPVFDRSIRLLLGLR